MGIFTAVRFAKNKWYHVAATRNSSDLVKLYVNGTVVSGTKAKPLNLSTSLGAGFVGAGSGIANVRIWSIVRTAQQIENYSKIITENNMDTTTGILAWWPLTQDLNGVAGTVPLTGSNPTFLKPTDVGIKPGVNYGKFSIISDNIINSDKALFLTTSINSTKPYRLLYFVVNEIDPIDPSDASLDGVTAVANIAGIQIKGEAVVLGHMTTDTPQQSNLVYHINMQDGFLYDSGPYNLDAFALREAADTEGPRWTDRIESLIPSDGNIVSVSNESFAGGWVTAQSGIDLSNTQLHVPIPPRVESLAAVNDFTFSFLKKHKTPVTEPYSLISFGKDATQTEYSMLEPERVFDMTQIIVASSAVSVTSVPNAPGPNGVTGDCLLYTSPSPRDKRQSRMPSSA